MYLYKEYTYCAYWSNKHTRGNHRTYISNAHLVNSLLALCRRLVWSLGQEDPLGSLTPLESVVSDSVWPLRRQPTKLPRPWDSPGKNTGVGCHFLLQCRKVKSESEVAQSCPTLSDPMDCQPTRLLRPWDFPGKSTGVGCHCLLRPLE